MSWLELDDGILRHPKFIRATRMAGSEAVHLWLGLRAYCGQFLTDGLIPTDMIDSVDGPASNRSRARALDALVKCGLLDQVEGGLQMHDYSDWSATREEILKKRAIGSTRSALRANAELMRSIKQRDHGLCRYCGIQVDWKDHRSPTGGTYDHVLALSKGGTNDIANVVVACRACNSGKQDRQGKELLPIGTTGRNLVVVPTPLPSPPILSHPDPDQNMPAPRARVRSVKPESDSFKAFYASYPRHVGRDTAWLAWKAKGCEELTAEIMAALEWQKRLVFASCPPDKVPHPASWINAGRWKDERPRAALTVSRPDPNCRGWHEGGKNTSRKHPSGRQPMCPECKSIELHEWTAEDRTGEPTPIGEIS